jgi:hypothetical protein
VLVTEADGWLTVEKPLGPTRIGRAISMRFEGEVLALAHRVTNHSDQPIVCAPWCLTVMAAGGECVFPMPPSKPHAEALLPAAPLVLWHYTDMTDSRWTWGRRLIRLRQTDSPTPQKVGAWLSQGWAAYLNHGNVFLKTFDVGYPGSLPDFGCNFETFTRHDMLEVESLGSLAALPPGESAVHNERWSLAPAPSLSADETGWAEWLEASAERTRA